MEDKEFIELMENEGYRYIRVIEGRGWCGLRPFMYTTGLCYGLNEHGYDGRFCYTTYMEARVALELWDGCDNPYGQWKKHKGYAGEFTKKEIEAFMNKPNVE